MNHPPDTDRPLSLEDQKGLILGILVAFLEGGDDVLDYFDHVGFDLRALRGVQDLPAAWLGHYRIRQSVYDVNRAYGQLATWPPIAARIAELRAERAGSLAN